MTIFAEIRSKINNLHMLTEENRESKKFKAKCPSIFHPMKGEEYCNGYVPPQLGYREIKVLHLRWEINLPLRPHCLGHYGTSRA